MIHDSIYPSIYNSESYLKTKTFILELEKKYGYEPELKYILLDKSFSNDDLDFFKKELSTLVKNYGFNIIYESESKSYYDAITVGELSEWFKKMYLENHFIWMENNFLKQIDLRKLNELKNHDQLINNYRLTIEKTLELDSIQKNQSYDILHRAFFENLSTLYSITRKYDYYPTAKSFALIQNSFGVVEYHNYQAKPNFEKTWILFYPFYKEAYLKNEIDYIEFKNYDNWSFIHYKKIKFDLINVEEIPLQFNPDLLKIAPIIDPIYKDEIWKEFGWKNNKQ
ncbi:hypothetical protein [Formosa maritima]|uniref:Uncharacterized protein n=1 Tax=Formosa maritima TaxID=2592046 RepID=A0A5D0GER9_9FLAO|nr:hypothetical protein [Formosa maritima]TYA57281.1 hypothetical protein FVF61_05080 [Formosa maritima]